MESAAGYEGRRTVGDHTSETTGKAENKIAARDTLRMKRDGHVMRFGNCPVETSSPKVLLTYQLLRNTMGAHLSKTSPNHEKIYFNHLHRNSGLCRPELHR